MRITIVNGTERLVTVHADPGELFAYTRHTSRGRAADAAIVLALVTLAEQVQLAAGGATDLATIDIARYARVVSTRRRRRRAPRSQQRTTSRRKALPPDSPANPV